MMQEERKYISQACYICLSSKTELVNADNSVRIPLSVTEYKILSFFIDHANTPVYLEELAQHIWGVNYQADQKNPDSLKSQISRVRDKLEKIRSGLRNCLDTNYGLKSYTLKIDRTIPEYNAGAVTVEEASSGIDVQEGIHSFPHILTKSPYYVDERDVLHREEDINQLVHQLSSGKETILISGFGGVGKTSLSRVLYAKLASQYDCIGWVEYIDDVKTSVLSSLEMYNEIQNQEYRWKVLSNSLKNSNQSILLFIDNVDRNLERNQDPLSDHLLYEITGWPNLSIVITSRLEELRGYHVYSIEHLSPEDCEDLFYFYYRKSEYAKNRELRSQRGIVQRLIERAGYHTLAIELLAKSAKRISTLDTFAEKISSIGFQFPSRRITTNHNDIETSAANQLRSLFDMNSRSTIEQHLLWDISVLPNTVLSFDELYDWLGYSENDVDGLIFEGWLSSQEDGVYMHPLVKEVIHFDLVSGKAIPGTASKLIDLLNQNCFFNEHDTFKSFIRKFEISNHVLGFINLSNNFIPIMQYMGAVAQRIGKVSAAISYFRRVLDAYLTTTDVSSKNHDEALARIYNDLGYQLSYTSNGRIEAQDYLKKALEIRELLYHENPSLYAESFATTCDYLGYLLSDDLDSIDEGESLLRKALAIRDDLAETHAGHYIHDAAWTRDNLGFLLSMTREKYEEAEWQLREALRVRRFLESQEQGEYLTEIAWTCRNLAFLLQVKGDTIEEAEEFYAEANNALQKADDKMPGVHMADIASNHNNMAVLLSTDKSRQVESIELLKKAQMVFEELEEESPGLYYGELAAIINNLAVVSILSDNNVAAAESLLFEAINIYGAFENARSDLHRKGLLETIYNLGLLYYLKGDYKNAIKQFQLALNKSSNGDSAYKLVKLDSHPDYVGVLHELFNIGEIYRMDSAEYVDTVSDDMITHLKTILSKAVFTLYALSGSRIARIECSVKADNPLQ